jgi:hypothetical protein
MHANIVLKMGVILLSTRYGTVEGIGSQLNELHTDELTSGGYWLYDYLTGACYSSDKFIDVIGYERHEVEPTVDFFYKTADVEKLNKGFKMIDDLIAMKAEHCFIHELLYTHKDGSTVNVQCSGTVFYKFDEPFMVLGTHKIV